MTLPARTRLGPYEVLAPIGAGGMGEESRNLRHRGIRGEFTASSFATQTTTGDRRRRLATR